MTKLRVLFWGNSTHGNYKLAKIFKQFGHKVELYMMSLDTLRSDPKHLDLKSYPNWIKQYDNVPFFKRIWVPKYLREHVNNNFDVVIVCGLSIINSHCFKIPVLIFPTGGELNDDPFFKKGHTIRPMRLIECIIHNYSIQKSKKILSLGAFTYDVKAYARLRHKGILSIFTPIDKSFHIKMINKNLLKKLNEKYSRYDLVILWLSRINMKKNSPSYKAPEKFLNETIELLNTTKSKIKIIYGKHGTHVKEFEKKIQQTNMQNFFEAVPHLKYSELQTYLSIKNAVLVETMSDSGGNMSGMARDCMALGTVMITNYNEDVLSFYPETWPIFKVNKNKDLLLHLRKILKWNKKDFEAHKLNINSWFNKYMCSNEVFKFLEIKLRFEVLLHKNKNSWIFPFSMFGKNK